MSGHSIILFDGICNLCNAAVQFVIRRDNKRRFLFASLQSGEARKILTENKLPAGEMNSFILVENGKVYDRSTAVLRVARKLKGLWPVLYSFMIIPKFIRDRIYQLISKNRYQWFGKKNECMIPTPELRARFLN